MRKFAFASIITGIGILLFWIAFFAIGLAPENAPACYTAYEHAFPLPDAVLSIALIVMGVRALKREKEAPWLLAPAGGLIFLGLVDFAFNVQNGIYTMSIFDGIVNAFINIWCVVMGLAICLQVKKHLTF